MLAPPPEGTFDIDPESVPLKSTPTGDATPEQTPLLANEEGVSSTSQNTSKKWEVSLNYSFSERRIVSLFKRSQPCT